MNSKHVIPTIFGISLIGACLMFYGLESSNHEIEKASPAAQTLIPAEAISLEEAFRRGEEADKKAQADLKRNRKKQRVYELNQTTVYCSATGAAYWAYHNTTYGQDVSIAPAFDVSSKAIQSRILNCDEAEELLKIKINEIRNSL